MNIHLNEEAGKIAMASPESLNPTAPRRRVAQHSRMLAPTLAVAISLQFGTAHGATTTPPPTIAQLNQTVSNLQAKVNALETQLNAVKSNSVLALGNKLRYDSGNNAAVFSGVDVQIVNGTGDTTAVNGFGNLILGYNEQSGNAMPVCTYGQANSSTDCYNLNPNAEWGPNLRGGSHNLVIGRYHSYTRWSGIVAGEDNAINGPTAAVLGGRRNRSGVEYSVVSGGMENLVLGSYGAVTAGSNNTVYEQFGAISGGERNIVGGIAASVGGGHGNQAIGRYSGISGGANNVAGNVYSSIAGGMSNHATGSAANVLGGFGNTARGDYSTIAGGNKNYTAELAWFGSVGGGLQRSVSDKYDWRAGGNLFSDW